jgi:hypothetical protein
MRMYLPFPGCSLTFQVPLFSNCPASVSVISGTSVGKTFKKLLFYFAKYSHLTIRPSFLPLQTSQQKRRAAWSGYQGFSSDSPACFIN